MLNRSALIVRPAQPYIEWAKSLPDADEILPRSDGERTVYLVEEILGLSDQDLILKVSFKEIFERELYGWCTDEDMWPQKRTLQMFKQWFTIEFHSVVEDLLDAPLEED